MKAFEKLPAVLFVPSNDANFREMTVVAQFLKKKDLAQPIFVPEKQTSIHSQENPFCTLKPESLFDRIWHKTLSLIIGKLYPIKQEDRLRLILSYKLKKKYKKSLKILQKRKPISIVLRGDRHLGEGWEPAFIKAGKKLNIPTVVLTYSYTSDPESLLYRRRARSDLDGSEVEDIEQHFPGQYYFDTDTKKNILYRPTFALEALKENGMLPRYPWVMGGGNSDYIIVAGENTKQRLIRLQCYKDKIIVTGLAVHDELFNNYQKRDAIKRDIYQKYNFENDKPLIIVSPLQLFEEKLTDLATAQDELDSLMNLCSRLDANILVSLHPRMKKSLYGEIIARYSIPVADEPLFDIVVCSDIFTAPYSSTVEWAVMCGIPTVIFDFYKLNYSIFEDYKGIVVVKEKVQYGPMINGLLLDPDKYQTMVEQQISTGRDLSPFDGKCLFRIADVVMQENKPSDE
jgi:hypothetical protein